MFRTLLEPKHERDEGEDLPLFNVNFTLFGVTQQQSCGAPMRCCRGATRTEKQLCLLLVERHGIKEVLNTAALEH